MWNDSIGLLTIFCVFVPFIRVAERALPATIALHNALQSQLGVDNRIGATFGEVYCGAVGGVKRHG